MPVIKDISKLVSSHYISESLSNWQGDIEDIDTEQLVNALCENHAEGVIKIENINEVVNQSGSRCRSPDAQPSKNCQEELFEESPVARLGREAPATNKISNRRKSANIMNKKCPFYINVLAHNFFLPKVC